MSVFDVDFGVLSKQLLPVRLRQAVMVAWMNCLVSPVKYVQVLFNANRAANLYLLAHTGQVTKLQAALNDTFDNLLRRITITDGVFIDPDYVYLVDEDKPLFIDLVSEIGGSVIPAPDPVPLYTGAEVYAYGGGNDFTVRVPVALELTAGQVLQLMALVNLYRLPAKAYNIVYF